MGFCRGGWGKVAWVYRLRVEERELGFRISFVRIFLGFGGYLAQDFIRLPLFFAIDQGDATARELGGRQIAFLELDKLQTFKGGMSDHIIQHLRKKFFQEIILKPWQDVNQTVQDLILIFSRKCILTCGG